jgi:hypothetical protein
MAIVGAISLVMIALVMGGPKVFEKILPEDAVAWLNDFGMGNEMATFGSFGGSTAAGDDPQSHLRDTSDGWRPSDKIAAMPGNRAVFIADVISGRRTSIDGHSPQGVSVLTPVADCRITPPGNDVLVGHVSAWSTSGLRLGLSTYGDAELAAAVQKLGGVYRNTGSKMLSGTDAALRENSFDAYDVVVTETARPVYLVLQSSDDLRIWNLHLAPGARLQRVVLLGGRQAGVLNLPDGVPVEVLRSAELDACGFPRPFYALNPGALIFQSIEAGALDADEAQVTLDRIAAQGDAYDAWFRAQFGVSADDTMAGNWIGGNIAVAGPKPATPEGRAEWRPVKGATALVTTDAYLEYEGLTASGAGFEARVMAIAKAYAWGDLGNLEQGVDF